MKSFNILVAFLVLFAACGQQKKEGQRADVTAVSDYTKVGKEIAPENSLEDSEMLAAYRTLEKTDSLNTKFSATVTEVCKAKGCWMKLDLGDDGETLVKFKDYGFFMPLDIEGKEVTVNGVAFVEEMSIEDRKHFAEDAGKTEEEIKAITQTKKTFGFIADGVLIKQED